LRKEDAPPLKNEDQLDIGEMEAADKDLVIALLRQYADITEKKKGCPPLATVKVQHHINTRDAAPIMLRCRRQAVSEYAVIDKNVDEMLEGDVIEPGEGAWGFPVVMVRKKDGTVRFCIDYRALNAVSHPGFHARGFTSGMFKFGRHLGETWGTWSGLYRLYSSSRRVALPAWLIGSTCTAPGPHPLSGS
jgi:hypothetical protein